MQLARARATYTTMAIVLLAAAATAPCRAVTFGAVNLVASANGGKIIKATSQFDDVQWATRNLIDGRHITYVKEGDNTVVVVPKDDLGRQIFGWASKDNSYPQEIVFAFAEEKPKLIGKVVVDPVSADPKWTRRWVRDIEVLVSETTADGLYRPVDNFLVSLKEVKQTFVFRAPVQARYVKLRINSNHGSPKCVSMGEFEVYEAIVGTGELDVIIEEAAGVLDKLQDYTNARTFAQTHAGGSPGEPPLNVALAANGGRIISASSERGQEWAAANLLDGQVWDITRTAAEQEGVSYGWSSTTAPREGVAQDIVIGFGEGETKLINEVVIDAATVDGFLSGRWANRFEVHVTADTPTTGYRRMGQFRLANRPGPQHFEFQSTEAKYVRIRILSNQGSDKYVELGEIGIYRAQTVTDPIVQITSRWEVLLQELMRYRDEQARTTAAAGGGEGGEPGG
ncbi:MAG: discoidin domain-containing protein [Armatimonadota bacterium]